jgi:hypothetical protein
MQGISENKTSKMPHEFLAWQSVPPKYTHYEPCWMLLRVVEDMPVSTMESDIDGSHGDHQGHTYLWI